MVTRRDNPYWRTKHEGILEAAFGEFTSRGFELASMEKIAENAGVSKVTVYNHFETKEKLFIACVEHFFEFLYKPFLYEVNGAPSGYAQVLACIENLIGYCFTPANAAMLSLLRAERPRCLSLGIKRSESDLFPAALTNALAATFPGPQKRALALAEMICSVIHRHCLEVDPGKKVDGKRRADLQTRIIALLNDAEIIRP